MKTRDQIVIDLYYIQLWAKEHPQYGIDSLLKQIQEKLQLPQQAAVYADGRKTPKRGVA